LVLGFWGKRTLYVLLGIKRRQKLFDMSKRKKGPPNPRSAKPTGPTEFECFFDGACEPINPGGTASYGAVIFDAKGIRVWECSEFFAPEKGKEHETSNNVAEYSGLIAILEYFIEQGSNESTILVRGDSNMVIQQLFGTWMIKSGHYAPLAQKAVQLLDKFPKIFGEWIPRERNSIADELSKAKLKKAGITFRMQPE
jgi:ribonuclease HI